MTSIRFLRGRRVAHGVLLPFLAAIAGPAATWAPAWAQEIRLEDLQRYGAPAASDQVTSTDQFSDVQPTDWAYQALSGLIQRYGCVAGYPDGTFRGSRAISRYEAAALLNACLDRISEETDELRRLLKEFERELVLVRARVDGLEARVGVLEATQFSTTTTLRGEARMVVGGLDYGGNTTDDPLYTDPDEPGYTPLREALTFNYDLRLILDTSFTGKDLLRTQLRAGNFSESGFGALPTPLTRLDAQFDEPCGNGSQCDDDVFIDRLYYQFPLWKRFTVVAGPRVRQDELLPVWPSLYTPERILKIFQYAGAPGTYSQLLGAGGGLWWSSGPWSLGTAYVSTNGNVGAPDRGGIGTSGSAATGTVQLAYTGSNWNLTAGYTYGTADVLFPGTPVTVEIQPTTGIDNGYTQSVAISGYWDPFRSRWLPSISAGYGLNRHYYTDTQTLVPSDERGYRAASESWMVGLIWNDAFLQGNTFGVAFGQPMRASNTDGDTVCQVWFPPACRTAEGEPEGDFHDPEDANYALEVYYRFQVSDQIAITPAVFWLSRPLGQYTIDSGPGSRNDGTLSTLGYLVQASFRF